MTFLPMEECQHQLRDQGGKVLDTAIRRHLEAGWGRWENCIATSAPPVSLRRNPSTPFGWVLAV